MRANRSLTWLLLLLLALTSLVACSYAKPLDDDSSKVDTELSDLNATPAKNKTAAVSGEEDSSDSSDSLELTQSPHAFPHRDEDQLNTATNLVLAGNYKYDVEILESGDNDDDRDDSKPSVELEERFKGNGVYKTDTFVAENIEMTPVDVQPSHMMLSMVLLALTLLSVAIYGALIIWRSHLEQRYGMRERLVNRDVDEDGVDDLDFHVAYPHTLSPYAATTTRA